MAESADDPMPAAAELAVGSLRFGLSPRFDEIDEAHIQSLMEVFHLLPPILVATDRRTVIDGIHRTTAARRLGRETIAAVVFGGDAAAAEIEAVACNIRHGLPLSRSERAAAARRLLESQPELSDRRLADICGLSARTLAELRCSTEENVQLNRRIGKDGRSRPNDPATQRNQIAAELALDPTRPVRQVAALTGSSPATVLDVRRRIERGIDPVPERLKPRAAAWQPEVAPQRWTSDNALKTSDGLAHFAEWLDATAVDDADWQSVVTDLPLGRLYGLIDEADARAAAWKRFAEALNRRVSKQQ